MTNKERKALIASIMFAINEGDKTIIEDIVQRRPYTMVRVSVKFTKNQWQPYSGVGFSKQNPRADVWDADRGFDIALGRAINNAIDMCIWDEASQWMPS